MAFCFKCLVFLAVFSPFSLVNAPHCRGAGFSRNLHADLKVASFLLSTQRPDGFSKRGGGKRGNIAKSNRLADYISCVCVICCVICVIFVIDEHRNIEIIYYFVIIFDCCIMRGNFGLVRICIRVWSRRYASGTRNGTGPLSGDDSGRGY